MARRTLATTDKTGKAEKKKKEAVLARCALKNSLIFCKKNAVGTDEETPESKEEENEGIVVVDRFCNYSAVLRFRADSVRSHCDSTFVLFLLNVLRC